MVIYFTFLPRSLPWTKFCTAVEDVITCPVSIFSARLRDVDSVEVENEELIPID